MADDSDEEQPVNTFSFSFFLLYIYKIKKFFSFFFLKSKLNIYFSFKLNFKSRFLSEEINRKSALRRTIRSMNLRLTVYRIILLICLIIKI